MSNFAEQMPEYLFGGAETVAIWAVLEEEIEKLWQERDDYFAQLDLATATWGLRLWELAHGLEPDESSPPEYRRERVRARMRGQGTTTAAMIKNVAESFTNGQVDVAEYPEEYRMTLQYSKTDYSQKSLWAAKEAIGEIIPAHLACLYSYLFELEVKTNNKLILSSLYFALFAKNLGIETVRLDGMHRLDGTWLLTSIFTRGLGLARLVIVGRIANHNTDALKFGYHERFVWANRWYPMRFEVRATCGIAQVMASEELTIAAGYTNVNKMVVQLVQDTMWSLGSEEKLNGKKRLNAAIIRSDL